MSIASSAYKRLCALYRNVLAAMRTLNARAQLGTASAVSYATLEALEPRLLLNGAPVDAPISDIQGGKIVDGLYTMANFCSQIEDQDQVKEVLPFSDYDLATRLNSRVLLYDYVCNPVADYFDTDSTPTAGELVQVLKGLSLTENNVTVTVDQSKISGGQVGDGLFQFNFAVDLFSELPTSIWLPDETQAGGLQMYQRPQGVQDAHMRLDLMFGLAPDFYVEFHSFIAGAEVIGTDISGNLDVGFLGTQVHDGEFRANLDYVASVPAHLTAAQMSPGLVFSLIGLTVKTSMDATLPVHVDLPGFPVGGNPVITLESDDILAGGKTFVTFNADAAEISRFRNITSGAALNMISQYGTALQGIANGDMVNKDIAFADASLGQLLDLDGALNRQVVRPLKNINNVPVFHNAQQFGDSLEQALGLSASVVQPHYDPASHILSYHLLVHDTGAPAQAEVAIDGADAFTVISGDSKVTLSPSATLEFDLQFDLSGQQAVLVAKTDAPANGRLSGDAHFSLQLAGGTAVNVVVKADGTNNGIDALVADINVALTAAGLLQSVHAGRSGNRLTLSTIGTGSAFLKIAFNGGDKAGELGFTTGQLAQDSFLDYTYVENASLDATVAATGAGINALGRMGMLDVDIKNGTLTGTTGMSLELKDPTTGASGGRVSLRELQDHLAPGDVGSVITTPIWSGTSTLVLPMRANPNIFGANGPADPRITLTAASSDPHAAAVDYNADMTALRAAEHISSPEILAALTNIKNFLAGLEALPGLSQQLPLIHRTMGELFDLATLVSVPDHPIASIGTLAQDLRAALDIPSSDLTLTYAGNVLHIAAKVTRDVTEAIPLFLDMETYSAAAGGVGQLEGLKSLLDQAGAAKLPVQAHLALQVNMGIDFTDPLHPRTFMEDTTALDITVKAGGSGLNFTFNEGPLVLQVTGGSANLDGDGNAATTSDAAHLTASIVDDNSDGRHYFDELTVADAQVHQTGQAHVSLPIFYPTASDLLGTLNLAITNVDQLFGSTTLTSPDITALFASCDLANGMGSVIGGLDSYLVRLDSALDAQALARSFPLVGGQLAGQVTFLADLRASLAAGLHAQLDGKLHQSADLVRQGLVDALGPSGMGVLNDRDGNGVIGINDIQIVTTDLDNDGQADDRVQLNLSLHKALTLMASSFNMDLGLPAVGLTVLGDGRVSVGYDMALNFGVDRTDGFYVDTSAIDELNIAVDASIADMSARPGYLSYLPLVAGDEDADGTRDNSTVDVDHDGLLPSHFVGTFHVDVAGAGDNRLTYSELSAGPNPAAMVSATLDADAQVNLDLLETFSNQANFPRIRTQFHMGWVFTSSDADLAGHMPTVSFSHIGLNLSDFFTQFVKPMLTQIREFTTSTTSGPMGQIVSFLDSRVPLLSDFTEAIGLGPVRMLDVAKTLGGTVETDFIDANNGVGQLLASIPTIDPNVWLDMGGFDFAGIDLRPLSSLGGLSPHVTPPATDPMSQLPAAAVNFLSQTADVGGAGAGMTFNLLNSGTIRTMLMGQDAGLFSYDMPGMDVQFHYSQEIPVWPVPPIFIEFSGTIIAQINIGPFGFDTYGLRKALELQDPTEVMSGFFVTDHPGREATLIGSIMAGGGVDLGFISVSVDGGITNDGGVFVKLKDPNHDGITRMDEILEPTKHGLLCSFDTDGRIMAGLTITVKYGIGPFSTEQTRTIASFAIMDFTVCKNGCFDDRFEPDDDILTAGDIGATPGTHITGVSILTATDQDWYAFELIRPDSIDVKLKSRHIWGEVDFDVLDEQGNILGRSTTQSDLKVVTLENMAAGHYYLHVYGHGAKNLYKIYVEPSKRSETTVYYVNPTDVNNPALASFFTLAPGSDSNLGTTAWAPMATVAGVLAKYPIGPHSMIVVDTGVYGSGFTLTHDNEGAAYTGTPDGSTFDVYNNIVTLLDSDNNLICYLTFAGKALAMKIAGDGIDDSVGNVIRSNLFRGNNTALLIQSDQHNLVAYNTISGAGIGISLPLGAAGEIRNNDIRDGTVGIDLASRVADVFDNDIYGNKVGLTVTGILGYPALVLAEPNRVRGNQTGVQIPASAGSAIVRFTRIYSNEIGLSSYAAASQIYGNDVYGNGTGMRGADVFGPADWADGAANLIHDNWTGVEAQTGATVRFDRIYANHSGVTARQSNISIHNNLIYRNLDQGVYLSNSDHVSVMNNTIFAPQGQGIYLDNWARNITIRNNIVWTQQGFDLKVETDSQAGLDTDYNNYFTSGTGRPVWYQKAFGDIYDWQVESYFDRHSIGYTVLDPMLDDPMFLDIAGDDYHLTPLASTSIDAGDPSSPYVLEPSPSGGRIDLGAYGNTTQAAASPAAYLKIEYPNFYTDWQIDQGHEIRWHSYGLTGNVQLAIYQGQTKLADIATVPVSNGSYVWSPSMAGLTGSPAQRYVIRITSESDPVVSDQSREPFSVPWSGGEFYVDDADNANDAFTPTAIGNNRNTGTTGGDPKANLMPILLMYDLGPGDRVNIDTGDYMFVRNAVISGDMGLQDDDEGATFTGPDNPAQAATIDRGNALFQDTAAFDVNNGDYVTLSHLTVKDGWYGVYAHNSSTNFHGQYLTATDNRLDGIHVESDSVGTVLGNLEAFGNQQYGIYVNAPVTSLSDSTAHDNLSAGFYLSNAASAVMENDEAYANGTGMIVWSGLGSWVVVGNADLAAGRGNRVHDNSYVGIESHGNVQVVGNVISNQEQPASHNGIGLYMSGGLAQYNVLYNNDGGLRASSSQILNNRVYYGHETGMLVGGNSLVSGNVVYSYDIGIDASNFYGSLANNLIYGNVTTGLLIRGAIATGTPPSGPTFVNNTVYQATGTAVRVELNSQGVTLRNNIIYSGDAAGYGIYVASDSQYLFTSDFNLIYTSGAKIGYWQNVPQASLADWQIATFGDAQSITQAPQLADVDGTGGVLGYHNPTDDGRDDDFHLLSVYGYIAGGSLAPVLGDTGLPQMLAGQLVLGTAMSPAIDRGRVGDSFALEPAPNGGYVDLGAYGNTAQASRSPSQYMLLTSPDGGSGQKVPIGQKLTVRWRSHDQQGTVAIDLLRGGDSTPVAQIATAAANTGELVWTIPDTVAAGDDYTVRVRRSDGPEDVSNNVFSISPPISVYYVNDSTGGGSGDWCTVAGNDANDGLSSMTPMASIRGLLQKYTLGAGAIIRVDSGVYSLTSNIIVTSDDSGVRIEGNPYGQVVLNRGNVSSTSRVFELQNADNLQMDHLSITGGYAGIFAASGSDSDGLLVTNCLVYNNAYYGIDLETGNDGARIESSSLWGTAAGTTDDDQLLAILVRSNDNLISGNIVSNARDTGIYVSSGVRNQVIGNTLHDVGTGISASFSGAVADRSTIADNTVYNVASVGIGANNVLISGNVVHDVTNTAYGISLWGGSSAVGNTVYSCPTGVTIGSSSYAIGNRIYNCSYVGLELTSGGTGSENIIYSNVTGIRAAGAATNNLVYANTSCGILVTASGSSNAKLQIANNTVYQEAGDAVRLNTGLSYIRLRNNILWSTAGAALFVPGDSLTSFDSDYNLLYASGAGHLATGNGIAFGSVMEWSYAIGTDGHSISADPQFVNYNGVDNTLGYVGGHDYGADDDFHLAAPSPGVDSGDPLSLYMVEPNSGGRVNLGADGNTPQATSQGPQALQVLSPNGNEKLQVGAETTISWQSYGLGTVNTIALIDAGSMTGVDNWLVDSAHGSNNTVGGTVDMGGVTNPAPASVYQTYATCSSGAGNQLSYALAVPDGAYTLRLHFADYTFAGQRRFDIKINGGVAQANFDIAAAAGGSYKAVTLSFEVTVSGGSGITLDLVNLTTSAAMLSAIELTQDNPLGAASPTVNVETSYDNGATWTAVASDVAMDRFGRGSVAWTPSGATNGNAGLVRVSAGTTADVCDKAFLVAPQGHDYYVNDQTTAGDVLTTSLGNNAGSGKTPQEPMASVPAVLAAYKLGPLDVIHVDAGTYNLSGNIIITGLDSGVTVSGAPTTLPVFNRGNTASGSYAFQLQGASDVTLDHLAITGGYAGVMAASQSGNQRVTVADCVVYGNWQRGIYLDGAANSTIRDNTLYNDNTAITVYAPGTTVSGNVVYGNATGIFASYTLGSGAAADTIHILGNDVYNNTTTGISGDGKTEITGNNVYGQTTYNTSAGIKVNGVTVAMDNTVHDNSVGISSSSGLVSGNRVYGNAVEGIDCSGGVVAGNTVYGNATGIWAHGTCGTISNNLIYGNSLQGMWINGTSSDGKIEQIVNNTIYQPQGDALLVTLSVCNLYSRNNIFWAAQGYAMNFDADSFRGLDSDYNLIYSPNPTRMAKWGAFEVTNLADWYYELDQDGHSLSANPMFVDAAGGNFLLQSGSPAIDAGDPQSYYLREGQFSGGRANLGNYGNTPQATASLSRVVQVLSLDGLEKLKTDQPAQITWTTSGLANTRPVALINVGGPTTDNWLFDNYRTSGSTYTFWSPISVVGASDPAPATVYLTYVSATSGVGNALSYLLPVGDGLYTLRLHFAADSDISRKFDIVVNGVVVAADFDIVAQAGGTYKATAGTFDCQATGGAGLNIRLVNKTSNPAILCGIELLQSDPAGAGSATADVEVSLDNGQNWTAVAIGSPLDRYGRGSASWTPSVATAGNTALVRVTSGASADTSNRAFGVGPAGSNYYVNDRSTAGDEYAAAIGDNTNSGLTPGAPMASLAALLAAYDLGAGDTVYVDSGTYSLLRNVLVDSNDSGVHIVGPVLGAAAMDRGNTSAGSYGIELVAATDVVLDHLDVTGAVAGIYAAASSASDRLVVSNSRLHGNQAQGLYVALGNYDAQAIGNTVYGNNDGIVALGQRMVISGNEVHDNLRFGIEADTSMSTADHVTISQNTVHANGTAGIYAIYSAQVVGNTVYNHPGSWQSGIKIGAGVTARGNTVYNNYSGILVASTYATGCVIIGNRAYANTYGVYAYGDTRVEANRLYNNNVGVYGSGLTGQVVNNLIYSNSEQGVLLYNSNAPKVVNNTIYQGVGDAIRLTNNTRNVSLRNNIIFAEVGYDLYVMADSRTGLAADYNLYHLGVGPAHVGSWNGAALDTLVAWRTASSQDAHSIQGNPKFVNPAGADGVLGYTIAGDGVDAGMDDNFTLMAGSAAIDQAEASSGPATDMDGNARADDPAVANPPATGYTQTTLPSSLFAIGGTAKNWRSDDSAWTLSLPFTFQFYGVGYSSVMVSSNGMLQFAGSGSATSYNNSVSQLITSARIAAYWCDLRTDQTGDDIFVDTTLTDRVTIRWNATILSSNGDANFAITLFADGRIRTDYGSGNAAGSPTIGISKGDGTTYILSPYNGMNGIGGAASVQIGASSAFVDIGACEFQGSGLDTVPPVVTGTSPQAIHVQSTAEQAPAHIVVSFSDALNSIDARAGANYQLIWAGPDAALSTADDMVYALTPTYTAGATQVALDSPGGSAMPQGKYRLILHGTGLHDLSGLGLDGDNNGLSGGDYVRDFAYGVASTIAGRYIFYNDSAWDGHDGGANSADDAAIAYGREAIVEGQESTGRHCSGFSLGVNGIMIDVDGLADPLGVSASDFVFKAGNSNDPASWLAAPAPASISVRPGEGIDGSDRVTIIWADAAIHDKWLQVRVLSDANGGNVHLADDDVFYFANLPGDFNGDGAVDISDLGILAGNYGKAATIIQGDANGDGVVDISDLGILAGNYAHTLVSPAVPDTPLSLANDAMRANIAAAGNVPTSEDTTTPLDDTQVTAPSIAPARGAFVAGVELAAQIVQPSPAPMAMSQTIATQPASTTAATVSTLVPSASRHAFIDARVQGVEFITYGGELGVDSILDELDPLPMTSLAVLDGA